MARSPAHAFRRRRSGGDQNGVRQPARRQTGMRWVRDAPPRRQDGEGDNGRTELCPLSAAVLGWRAPGDCGDAVDVMHDELVPCSHAHPWRNQLYCQAVEQLRVRRGTFANELHRMSPGVLTMPRPKVTRTKVDAARGG